MTTLCVYGCDINKQNAHYSIHIVKIITPLAEARIDLPACTGHGKMISQMKCRTIAREMYIRMFGYKPFLGQMYVSTVPGFIFGSNYIR